MGRHNVITEESIAELWDMVYNISLGMLHQPQEAEEAVQEIFLKVWEKRSSFQGRSSLKTWIYTIARNHLLDTKQKAFSRPLTFELFAEEADSYTFYEGELGLTRQEEKIFTEEVKVGCTLAMLQCLDRENRFIFVIGSIFQFKTSDGARICALGEEAYRQRLSRSRKKMLEFLNGHCGLINSEARCQCRRGLKVALDKGRLHPEKLLFKSDNPAVSAAIGELNQVEDLAKVFQNNPFFRPDSSLKRKITDNLRVFSRQLSVEKP